MTLLDVEELVAYWAGHPPVHLMVAAYLGIKPSDKKAEIESFPTDLLTLPPEMLGPSRSFSEAFGPGAVDAMRDLWNKFETARQGSH
jgi:hypothetical protein